MSDMIKFCTGKLAAKKDASIPTFRWFMDGVPSKLMPTPTAEIGWSNRVQRWPMLGNDKLNNCLIASAMHAVQLWDAANDDAIWPDLDCAIANFSHAVGYDPVTGANNVGAYLIDILKFWMNTGLAITPDGSIDRLDGYAFVNPADTSSLQRGISFFGLNYCGVELSQRAMEQFAAGEDWDDCTGDPLDGHGVPMVDWNAKGPVFVTWGRRQQASVDWWLKYGSESYVPLRRDWIGKNGLSPSNMTMAQLDAKITAMKGLLGVGAT
jgi:hypothetical protein